MPDEGGTRAARRNAAPWLRGRIGRCVAILAGVLSAAPAGADDHVSFASLDVAPVGMPWCQASMVVNLPSSWRPTDGAAVLLALGPAADVARDALVAALLGEHAAVLELAPRPCAGMPAGQDGLVATALGALDALKRTMGAGLVVAIGHGPGSAALLGVVGAASGGLAEGSRYAAAVALGDGVPGFARGERQEESEQAPGRLGLLCSTLALAESGIGATPSRDATGATAAACSAALAEDESRAATAPAARP
jgi:hypothetical protein